MALHTLAKKTHWQVDGIGVLLLFAASILLLVTTISAPVVNDIGLLRVTLTNRSSIRNSSVSFGSFGYCILDVALAASDQDWCAHSHIGYAPNDVMARIDGDKFSNITSGTSEGLTRAMVLHPVACGLAFVAFLAALGMGMLGSLVAGLAAFLAWIFTLVALAIDFSVFGVIRHHVNHGRTGSKARFGLAIWTLLAAFLALFFGMLLVFMTCFSTRRERNKQPQQVDTGRKKKRFGIL